MKTKQLFVGRSLQWGGESYNLAAIAMIILLSNREGFLLSVMTFLTVPLWAGLGNLIRLVSIALALEWFQVDFTEETPHMFSRTCRIRNSWFGFVVDAHLFVKSFGAMKVAEKTNAVVEMLAKFYNFIVAWPARSPDASVEKGEQKMRRQVE